MPALKPTDFTATITYLGHVADRDAMLDSAPQSRMVCTYAGPEGEAHGGETRPSCSRVLSQHPRGTDIRNVRQFSILSEEELDQIAADMGIDQIKPEWLGATIVVKGIADFSHVPPSSRLQGPDGTTLVVDMENRPCTLPAPVIEAHLAGKGKLFKPAARGRRGITAWVERQGVLNIGDELRLHIPHQPIWAHLGPELQKD